MILKASTYILKRAFKYNKKIFWSIACFIIATGITPYMYMILMAYIINAAEKGTEVKNAVLVVLSIICVGFVFNLIKSFFSNTQEALLNDYRQNEKRELIKKALSRSYQELETAEFWSMYQRAQLSVQRNFSGNEGLLRNLIELCTSIIPFVLAIIAVRELDVIIIGIILLVAFVGNWLTFLADRLACQNQIQLSRIYAKADNFIHIMLNLSFQKDIRVSMAGRILKTKYRTLTIKITEEEEKIYKKNCKIRWTHDALLAIQDIVIYLILIHKYRNNEFDIAEWTLLISVMTMITFELSKISQLLSQMKSNSNFVFEFKEFIEKENQKKKSVEYSSTRNMDHEPILRLENVDYFYREYQALKRINLSINKGERIAVVGLNGAGKSTLIKLIVGLYQPSAGDLYFMGQKTSILNREEYYRHFACAFQEINIYPYSLLTNVSLHSETETDAEKVLSLVKTMTSESFVENMPKKEHTVLSRVLDNEGVELSGGQKQAISLCRSFYRNSEVMILDEPTAALDPIAEKRIFEEINELADGKTLIFVSHRLVSTMFCDKIVLLQNGSILEYGTHEQLMSCNGVYAELYKIQTSYYTSGESYGGSKC